MAGAVLYAHRDRGIDSPRRREICNDVDIVCVPKLCAVADLAGDTGQVRNLVREELIRYVKATPLRPGEMVLSRNGTRAISWWRCPKCELDLWCANDLNFGTRLMCRTGSKEHNIWLAQRAQRHGFHWDPYRGLETPRRTLLAAATEAEIYAKLDLPFITPELPGDFFPDGA
jgi:DNA polymerase/3'-5' exonuclease PolX